MDLENLGSWKPGLTEEFVRQLTKELYDLETTSVKSMCSFNDQNFHIKVSKEHKNPFIRKISKDGYTFKIINTKKTEVSGHFSSMHSALFHLESKGMNVPLPILNLDGSTFKILDVPLLKNSSEVSDGIIYGKCGVQLLTYLPGVPMSTVDWTEDMVFEFGHLLARFHNALQDLHCRDLSEKKILYDIEHINCMVEMNIIGNLIDEYKQIALKTIQEFEDVVKPYLSDFQKGFIHGDFNDFNILIQKKTDGLGKEVCEVDGILDFEDVHRGSYIWDLCLMLAHILLDSKSPNPLEDVGVALAGYLSLRSFDETEMSVIKTCIKCRLCMSLIFCAWSRDIDPNNAYIACFNLDNLKNNWEKISCYDIKDLLQEWDAVRQRCFAKRNLS